MKPPCKNCITLSICKHQSDSGPVNFMNAIRKCEILTDFLGIKLVGIGDPISITSSLNRNIVHKRITSIRKYIHTGKILVSTGD